MDTQGGTRLSTEAYNRILAHIMSGKLSAGTVIQERQLAEELELSRTPTRDALLILEGEGLLEREGRRGVRVVSMDITRYMENLAIRRLLEGEAAFVACGKIPEEKLNEMKGVLEQLIQRYKDGEAPSRDDVRQIDEELHGVIGGAGGNRQLVEIVSALRRQTHIFNIKNLPERFLETCEEHLALIEALRPGKSATEARALMESHIAGVRESIINKLLPR